MALFNAVHDAQKTQLSYLLNYYPVNQIPDKTRQMFLTFQCLSFMPKHKVLQLCNEELTHMLGVPSSALGHRKQLPHQQYKIQWAFNNIPTEEEWNKKSNSYLIMCEYRHSHITGPIVVLSFGTVKHNNPAWAN